MAIKRPETVDIIEDVINALSFDIVGTTNWIDNNDGTYTLPVCRTYWVQEGDTMESAVVLGLLYTVTEVVKNTSITVSSSILPTEANFFSVKAPKYFHGTLLDVNKQVTSIQLIADRLPMCYLLEPFTETFFGEESSIDREVTLRLFFLTKSNVEDWDTDQNYIHSIAPMREMVNYLIDEVLSFNPAFQTLDNWQTTNRVRFGVYKSSKGDKVLDKLVFDEWLTGIELQLTLGIRKNFVDCYCDGDTPNIIKCAPVSVFENNVFKQFVQSGERFDYTTGGDCEPVNYVVKYEDNTIIEEGSEPSGGSIEVVVPNCPIPEPCADATAELYFDDELIDTLTIPSGDTDSFSIDCSTLLNAVRVESTELSHQHTGTFVLIGEENNKPKYEKVGDEDRIIRYDGTRWLLEKIGSGAHQHLAALGDEDFPWEADWADAYLLVSQATIGTYCANGSSAFYRLLDTEGNVILTGSIPSGDTSDITAPDGVVTITDTTPTTLHTVNVKSNGTATQQIADSVVTLNNTASTLISTTNVKAEGVETIVAPDATAVLKDTTGAVISTTDIPSNTSEDITAPDATVENTDASYSTTVASGGTLVLPDTTINVTDQDNNILDTITFPVYSTVNIDIDSYCEDATVENSDASYTDIVASGGTLVLPDSDVNVNGNLEGTVVSVKDIDIDVTDGTNPVTPDAITISGNTITIEVPAGGGGAPVGATLMKTGQTTSYRTGDDGDLEAGRATDFFTLASNNPFGNTDRFTDELGGQTYTNNIVIDWSTYDGATVLGWYRVRNGVNITGNDAIDEALTLSIAGYTSGWRLPNVNEAFSIMNFEGTSSLNYSPFNNNLGTGRNYTSTTNPANTTQLFTITAGSGIAVSSRTNAGTGWRYIPCRTFTVTGTTLT